MGPGKLTSRMEELARTDDATAQPRESIARKFADVVAGFTFDFGTVKIS